MFSELLEEKETQTHKIRTELVAGYVVETIRSKMAPNGEFLPARVSDLSGKVLWNFKEEAFSGRAFLKFHESSGEHIIAFVNQQNVLERITPLMDLGKIVRVEVDGRVIHCGGRGTREALEMKASLAKQLGLKFSVSPEEKNIINILEEREKKAQRDREDERRQAWQAEQARQKAEQEEQRQAKEQKRQERIQKILSRQKTLAYLPDGQPIRSIPVTEQEWPSLPDDTPVIRVDEHGQPLEAFYTRKKSGGRCEKVGRKDVTLTRPVRRQASQPSVTARGVIFVEINGEPQSLLRFSKDDLQRLRDSGLNSGTMVAMDAPDDKGRYHVLKLEDGKCNSVGLFTPIKPVQ